MLTQLSLRCRTFEHIATEVWKKIARNRRNGVPSQEQGITNDIVGILREESRHIPNLGVWSDLGQREALWGSDIDVFVEIRQH